MSLITFLTRVHFADGVLEDALPEAMRKLNTRRPLLLTDADGRNGQMLDRIEDAMSPGVVLTSFPQLPHSAGADRLSAAIQVLSVGECDCIISLGGKTAMDFGRLLAAQHTGKQNGQNTGQSAGQTMGIPAHPLIAIPTTVANVGLGPVHMPGIIKPRTAALPAAILCDATMTLDADKQTLAANGFHALTNCVEAFLATAYNPPADGIALEGIRRSALFLERAVAEHGNLDAHRELLAVALNAGLASQKGLGGVEALARATQAACNSNLAHGRLHPAVMRPVLAFNAPAVGNQYERIVEALALPRQNHVVDALSTMSRRLGLPETLTSLDIDSARLDHVAERAAADPANLTNPRHATQADYRALLDQAL